MTLTFTEEPILNYPYENPKQHWQLINGIPTDTVLKYRRQSEYIVPVPPSQAQAEQPRMTLGLTELSTEDQEYDPTPIINEIRRMVGEWRSSEKRRWGVTPETAKLLEHWRNHEWIGVRPFFCQVEAVRDDYLAH